MNPATYDLIYRLVFHFVPPILIPVNLATVLTTLGLAYLVTFEIKTWRKHR